MGGHCRELPVRAMPSRVTVGWGTDNTTAPNGQNFQPCNGNVRHATQALNLCRDRTTQSPRAGPLRALVTQLLLQGIQKILGFN